MAVIDRVIARLFEEFVGGPLQTKEQARMAASRIACVVCDTASEILKSDSEDYQDALDLHAAYAAVRKHYAHVLDDANQ